MKATVKATAKSAMKAAISFAMKFPCRIRARAVAGALVPAALAATLALAPAAHAGQSCEARAPTVHELKNGLELARRTAAALDASGAELVVLARAGQDLSRYGLRYSHLGFAYRTQSGWRVLHKLNHCGTAEGHLYRQGLAEFFMDDLHDAVAAYAVASPAVAAALVPVLTDNTRADVMHERRYNMVAYPWSTRYQQSNQWALETLAFALAPGAQTRERAQAWLQWQGYEPTQLNVPTFTRLGARVGSAHIAFDDHPDRQRYAGRIATVTVDSVFAWLRQSGHASAVRTVR